MRKEPDLVAMVCDYVHKAVVLLLMLFVHLRPYFRFPCDDFMAWQMFVYVLKEL